MKFAARILLENQNQDQDQYLAEAYVARFRSNGDSFQGNLILIVSFNVCNLIAFANLIQNSNKKQDEEKNKNEWLFTFSFILNDQSSRTDTFFDRHIRFMSEQSFCNK